jgi:hypothetical protein
MVPVSPADALGSHAAGVRDVLVEVVRSRHDRFVEAHQVSGTRYGMGFGSQWRDLLDDAYEALTDRSFQSHKLIPGGHKIPVVNNCLVYVWRVPDGVDAVARFASSPTKKNGFTAQPPDPMLFEPSFTDEAGPFDDVPNDVEFASMVLAVGDPMPVVLILVRSSPKGLQSIEWAVAKLDADTGQVKLHGQESIWVPEVNPADVVTDVESFDSGTPNGPTVEPQEQEGTQPDA